MTTAEKGYQELLASELPHAIHNSAEYQRYLQRIEELLDQKSRSKAEDLYLELLSVLIERYEEEYERVEAPDPLTALKELMAANDVSQADLSRLLGSSGLASMILSGKRQLSKAQILLLAKRFHVSPSLFIKV